jgi:hypothetical protein
VGALWKRTGGDERGRQRFLLGSSSHWIVQSDVSGYVLQGCFLFNVDILTRRQKSL